MRLGIQYPVPLTVLGHVELAKQADAWGYEAYAVTDPTVGNDPFPVLGAMAMRTRRIGLATDVASMISRHPVTLAATARTIDDLAPRPARSTVHGPRSTVHGPLTAAAVGAKR